MLTSTLSALGVALLAVVVVSGFGVIAVSAKRVTGVWFNPASLFGLAWLFLCGFPLLVVGDLNFNPAALIYLLVFGICFALPTFLLPWRVALEQSAKRRAGIKFDTAGVTFKLLVLSALAALAFHLLDLKAQGISVEEGLLFVAGQYAERRYAAELVENVFSKLALLASFQAAVLGGFLVGISGSFRRRLLVASLGLAPSVMVLLLQSAKGLVFLSAAYMIGAWMVARALRGDFSLPRVKVIPLAIGGAVGFGGILVSFAARFGWDPDVMRFYLASYSSGHLFAFMDWFSDRYFGIAAFAGYEQPELLGGYYTFHGVARLLGDVPPVPLGVYEEYFELPNVLITNIYTMFRGLISDFGLAGSLIAGAIWGGISAAAFFALLTRFFSVVGAVVYIYSVGLIYQSYGISSLTWISIPASAFVSLVLFAWIRTTSLRRHAAELHGELRVING